jgi:phage gpG-like protein
MFTLTAKTEDTTKKVEQAAEKANFRNFRHGAASVSKAAKQSIQRRPGPSAPGEPPNTHRRIFLRRSIRFAATKTSAIIGPMKSIVGMSAQAHEFGGTYKGSTYPARPFMQPAMVKSAPRFAGEWKGSIGS